MNTLLQDRLSHEVPYLDEAFVNGLDWALDGCRFHPDDWCLFNDVRRRHGFASAKSAPTLLTPPDANSKLAKTASYGLTLQSHVTTFGNTRVNLCPNAGRCVAVCVLNNGNGGFPVVQRSRDARTEYLWQHPTQFSFQFGYEVGKAINKYGDITLRPNVNSDLRWLDYLPSLATTEHLTCYGYTKFEAPELRDGYVEAYSLHERTPATLPEFLVEVWGASIAAVTNRKKGEPVRQWAQELLGIDVEVVDADFNDLWMLDAYHAGTPVIGDLSAKGKAQTLRRTEKRLPSRDGVALATGLFVQQAY